MHYRAGILSLREIVAPYGVTEGALRKRAKKGGWTRNVQRRIQAKAQELVNSHEVAAARQGANKPAPLSMSDVLEAEIVEVAARNVAVVRIKHREEIDRLRQMAALMAMELQATSGERKELSDLAHKLAGDKVISGDQVRAVERALSLGNRSTLLNRIADTMRIIIALEREAYGMADIPLGKDGDPATDLGDKPVKVVINVVDASVPPPEDIDEPEPPAEEEPSQAAEPEPAGEIEAEPALVAAPAPRPSWPESDE